MATKARFSPVARASAGGLLPAWWAIPAVPIGLILWIAIVVALFRLL